MTKQSIRVLLAAALLLPAAVPAFADDHDAETHLSMGSVAGTIRHELSRHWTLPSGLVLSARITDGEGRNIECGTSTGGRCTDAEALEIATDLAETGVQSVGISAGYSRDMGDYALTASVGLRYATEGPGMGAEKYLDRTSALVEVRLSRDGFFGFAAYEYHDPSGGGIGPQAVTIADHVYRLPDDLGGVHVGVGLRFGGSR